MNYLENNKKIILRSILVIYAFLVIILTILLTLLTMGLAGIFVGPFIFSLGLSLVFMLPILALAILILIIIHIVRFMFNHFRKGKKVVLSENGREEQNITEQSMPTNKPDKYIYVATGIALGITIVTMFLYNLFKAEQQAQTIKQEQVTKIDKFYTKKINFSNPVLIFQPLYMNKIDIAGNLIVVDEGAKVDVIKINSNKSESTFTTISTDSSSDTDSAKILDGKVYWIDSGNALQYDPNSLKVTQLPQLSNVLQIKGKYKNNLIVSLINDTKTVQEETIASYNLSTYKIKTLIDSQPENTTYLIQTQYLCYLPYENSGTYGNLVSSIDLDTNKSKTYSIDTSNVDDILSCDDKNIIWVTSGYVGEFNIVRKNSTFLYQFPNTFSTLKKEGNLFYFDTFANDMSTTYNKITEVDPQTGQEHVVLSKNGISNWDISDQNIIYEINKNGKYYLYFGKILFNDMSSSTSQTKK